MSDLFYISLHFYSQGEWNKLREHLEERAKVISAQRIEVTSFFSTTSTGIFNSSIIFFLELRDGRLSEDEDEFCFGWIINDIFGWLNVNVPIMRGYVPHFYSIWSRFTPFQPFQPSIAVMNFYLRIFEKKSNETQTRVFWALMTPYERKLFLIENAFAVIN